MKIYTWKCPEVKLNTQDTVSFSSACLASTKSNTTADYPSSSSPGSAWRPSGGQPNLSHPDGTSARPSANKSE